jgi:hypothetical protein
MKKLLYVLMGLGVHLGVHADIYKHVDADGHVTYSNVPIKGATKLDLEPPPSGGSSTKAAPARSPTPANFPRVDQQTQRQRDDKRRQILEDELANEKKALEEARRDYAEGEANPEMFTAANGKRFRNVPKYEEKMKGLQEGVSQHEKNIELLEKELGSLK